MRTQLGLWGDGEKLKLDGKGSVEMNNLEFVKKMREHAVGIAERQGKVSTDDLRAYAQSIGVSPEHPNAWGSIFRGKKWKIVGRVKSRLASNHAREIREWGIA